MADRIDILKTELTADPLGRDYSGMSDTEAAADLNIVYQTLAVESVSGSDILNATDDGEFAARTLDQQARWLSLCGVGTIIIGSGVAKALEADLFGSGTNTRANLQALKTRAVSRGVELRIGIVKVGWIQEARK